MLFILEEYLGIFTIIGKLEHLQFWTRTKEPAIGLFWIEICASNEKNCGDYTFPECMCPLYSNWTFLNHKNIQI